MERLTRKLKKGGYSANRHPAAQIDERLSQLKGVHKQWVGDVSDMITGMKQSEAAGQAGALTQSKAMLLKIIRRSRPPSRDIRPMPRLESKIVQLLTSTSSISCQVSVPILKAQLFERSVQLTMVT